MAAIVPKPVGVLPKTGQTTSYPTGGATDRDDGYYEAGSPVSPRFTPNGDGTVTDNATKLMWVQDPSLCGVGGYPNTWATTLDTPKTMKWTDAIANCEALVYAGHTDWRLPNINELRSIIDYSRVLPAIYTSYFTCSPFTSPYFYWSSTTAVRDTLRAFIVAFINGNVVTAPKADMVPYYVRPVRGPD